MRWKVAVDGLGHSTPVVWDGHVYVTAASPVGDGFEPRFSGRPGAHDNAPVTHEHRFDVHCFGLADGELRWSTTVARGVPHEGGHVSGTLASASPVADARGVVAFFGSRGLFALDREGAVVWQADLGDMATKHGHGEGSSPVLHGEVVAVNWDHEGQSFLAAFERGSGAERWRVLRDEGTSWGSPVVMTPGGGPPQVVVSGTGKVRGYDLGTGEALWEAPGLSQNVVASPAPSGDIVVAGSSYDTRAMIALDLAGARGELEGTPHLLWSRTKRTPYVPSPLIVDDSAYFLAHYQGVLSRVSLRTGEDRGGPFRLFGLREIYASPVAAGGRIYITDRTAGTVVLGPDGDSLRVLGVNRLDDRFSASAAVVGDLLLLRGEAFLYCLGEDAEP